MSYRYTPPTDHARCTNCDGIIPDERRGLFGTCTRSCSLAKLGLWSGFNPGNQFQVEHAAARLMNTYRVQRYPERSN